MSVDRLSDWPAQLQVHPSAFLAPGCSVVGEVTIGERASIWFGAVLRGDVDSIAVGNDSNIQDNSVVHVDAGQPVRIGRRVTVGHRAIVHGARVEDECLIGMGAIILSGATIGTGSLVGAGALVREGQQVPPGSLVVGAPARLLGPVNDQHRAAIQRGWQNYVQLSRAYKARGFDPPKPAPDDPLGVGAAPARRVTTHARHGVTPRAARCAILTVSDTRRGDADQGGALIASLLEGGGHAVVARAWSRDTLAGIRAAARGFLARRGVDVIVVTGGTGVAPSDVTVRALAPLIREPLEGFGELFRMASFEQVGAAAWLSRAGAGLARGRLIVWLPGAPRALELAARTLLIPVLSHIVGLLHSTPSPKKD